MCPKTKAKAISADCCGGSLRSGLLQALELKGQVVQKTTAGRREIGEFGPKTAEEYQKRHDVQFWNLPGFWGRLESKS